jgi:hypothetical protein
MTSRPQSADERRQTPPGQPLAVTAAPHEGETRVSAVFTALARAIPPEGLTLQDLLARLGERGPLLVCILVTVPFLLPVSIPGSSIPLGVIIALNGISLLTHRAPWLPGRLRHRRLAADALLGVCARGARLFTRLERFIHPRVPPLTHGPTMGCVNGLFLVLSGVLLMAPLPLPLSNTLPAYGALWLAAGRARRVWRRGRLHHAAADPQLLHRRSGTGGDRGEGRAKLSLRRSMTADGSW